MKVCSQNECVWGIKLRGGKSADKDQRNWKGWLLREGKLKIR